MATDAQRTYVKERWKWLIIRDASAWRDTRRGPVWELSLPLDGGMIFHDYSSEDACWAAAYDATLDRAEEIRQVQREIEVLAAYIDNRLSWVLPLEDDYPIRSEGPGLAQTARQIAALSRTLVRLRERLDCLLKGWKK